MPVQFLNFWRTTARHKKILTMSRSFVLNAAGKTKKTSSRLKTTISHGNHGPCVSWPLLLSVDLLRPLRSTVCVDRVMGDPAYDRRHLNRVGGCITPQFTMAIFQKKSINSAAATVHCHSLWTVRAHSAQRCALPGSWATSPMTGAV